MSTFPVVMSATDLAGALAKSQVNETQAGGVDFLKMEFDSGEWVSGQGGDVCTGEEILIFTPSIRHGWILWTGGRPKKVWARFTEALPPEIDPVTNVKGEVDEASEARGFEAAFVSDRSMISMDTNSYGGRKGIDALLNTIKVEAARGGTHLYPLVKLSSESYAGSGMRKGKLNYNPVFEFVAWCDEAGNRAGGTPVPVVDNSGPPAAARAEPTAETTPPARQRRRRAAA